MTWTVSKQVAPAPVLDLRLAGVDLTPHVVSWRYRWPWHGKITWDLQAWHTPSGQDGWTAEPSDFRLPGHGSFAGLLRTHDYTASRALNYRLKVAGMTWQAPGLLPRGPSFDGQILAWGGEDLTALLEREGQSFPDILLDQGNIVMAHTAMAEMAEQAGVSVSCRFPDFRIRVLRRARGRILDWMDSIGRVYQCGRTWDGSTLIYEPARTSRRPAWRFRDSLTIETWLVEETWDRCRNRFTVTRFEPVAGIIGEQSASGSGAVGRVGDISLSPPSRTAYPEIRTNMDLTDWVFFDEADSPISGNVGGILASATPAARVRFTSRPITPVSVLPPGTSGLQGNTGGAYTPFFDVVFTGSGRGSGAAHSSQYRLTVNDAATQAVYGVAQDFQDLEDPIIPTSAVAQDYADAVLSESVRHVYRALMRTPYLNPFVQPGQVVTVTDYLTGQDGVDWFVEAVTHNLDAGGDWSMELELSRGL